VQKGVIENAHFSGDFLATRELNAITNTLKGVRFDRAAVSAVLERFSLREYFGGIDKEEILDVMFINATPS
jgi:lipoate-protein ligase A